MHSAASCRPARKTRCGRASRPTGDSLASTSRSAAKVRRCACGAWCPARRSRKWPWTWRRTLPASSKSWTNWPCRRGEVTIATSGAGWLPGVRFVCTPKGLYSAAQGRKALRAHPGKRTPSTPRMGFPGCVLVTQGALARPWAVEYNPFGVQTTQSQSVPDVAFVVVDLVFHQIPAEFVLERLRLVMLFLSGNVDLHCFDMSGANGERTVAVLPEE